MEVSLLDVGKIKSQFLALENAVIDTSSIINIKKSHFLVDLQQQIKLHTINEVFSEYGIPVTAIKTHSINQTGQSTDQKVVALAVNYSFPIISEDKGILRAAQRHHLEYYNAVMMLEFLLFKKCVDTEKYQNSFDLLKGYCRYSSGIWDYIDKLHGLLLGDE